MLTAVPNTLLWLLSLPLLPFQEGALFATGEKYGNSSICVLVSGQPGVNEKKPQRNKKKKARLHGAALGTA